MDEQQHDICKHEKHDLRSPLSLEEFIQDLLLMSIEDLREHTVCCYQRQKMFKELNAPVVIVRNATMYWLIADHIYHLRFKEPYPLKED